MLSAELVSIVATLRHVASQADWQDVGAHGVKCLRVRKRANGTYTVGHIERTLTQHCVPP